MRKGPYYDIYDRVKSFQDNIDSEVMESVVPFDDEIIRLNTDEQLYSEGLDRTGAVIEPPYRPLTIHIKESKGQRTDHVTLRDEGDFHKSFRLEVSGSQAEVVADDPKTAKLVAKYGSAILGLSDDNLDYMLDEFIRPELQQRFENAVLQ